MVIADDEILTRTNRDAAAETCDDDFEPLAVERRYGPARKAGAGGEGTRRIRGNFDPLVGGTEIGAHPLDFGENGMGGGGGWRR